MGGRGQRFVSAGYATPKPFIDVLGKPMFQVAIENLNIDGKYFLIVIPEYYDRTVNYAKNFLPDAKIIVLNEQVNGAVPACISALDQINSSINWIDPVIISNCDQVLDWNSDHFLDYCKSNDLHGAVPTFFANSTAHSYALNYKHCPYRIKEIQEKKIIGNHALCGIHYWRTTNLCYLGLKASLAGPPHFNNDYYIAPTYNELIKCGKIIHRYGVDKMNILGTPYDLERYINENSGTDTWCGKFVKRIL